MRGIAAVLLIVVLVAGCGGGKTAGPRPATNVQTRAASPETPTGFTVRSVRREGFSIAIPSSWRSIDASTALQGKSIDQFEQENPAAAAAVEALRRPSSPMKLVAVDPDAEAGFATNVNVLVSRIPANASFATWTRVETAQLAALKPTHLRKAVVRLRPGKAYRLAYRARLSIRGTPRELALRQYMLKRGSSLYVVTYTTTADQERKLTPTFERSARTFDLTS